MLVEFGLPVDNSESRKKTFFSLFRLGVVRESYIVVEELGAKRKCEPSFAEATEGNFLAASRPKIGGGGGS